MFDGVRNVVVVASVVVARLKVVVPVVVATANDVHAPPPAPVSVCGTKRARSGFVASNIVLMSTPCDSQDAERLKTKAGAIISAMLLSLNLIIHDRALLSQDAVKHAFGEPFKREPSSGTSPHRHTKSPPWQVDPGPCEGAMVMVSRHTRCSVSFHSPNLHIKLTVQGAKSRVAIAYITA